MTKLFTILSVGLCLLACESGPRETNLSSRVSGVQWVQRLIQAPI